MNLVVDASVAAKWFLPEPGAAKARTLLTPRHRLLAPDLLWIEVANVLWKHVGRRLLDRAEAAAILDHALAFPIERAPSEPLLRASLDLAATTGGTVYDCLYLALAIEESATLVTDDAKLVRAVAAAATGMRSARATLLADL